RLAFADVDLNLPGGVGAVSDMSGALMVVPDGFAGMLEGSVTLSQPDLNLAGTAAFGFNTLDVAVDEVIEVGGANIALGLPAGPYLSTGLDDLNFDFLGVSATGDLDVVLSGGLQGGGNSTLEVGIQDLAFTSTLGEATLAFSDIDGFFIADDRGL